MNVPRSKKLAHCKQAHNIWLYFSNFLFQIGVQDTMSILTLTDGEKWLKKQQLTWQEMKMTI